MTQKTAEDRKLYKAAWHQQNKLKRPEDKKIFDIPNRKFLRKSGIYKISWDNCKYYYFGQSYNLQHRFVGHLGYLRRKVHENSKLQNVFNKYGKPIFTVIELCDVSELDKIEFRLIQEHSKDKYNCNIVIEDFQNHTRSKWTEERRRKLQENKINNGKSRLIYAYSSKTGELINKCYGVVFMAESVGLKKEQCAAICSVLSGVLKSAYGMYFSEVEKSNDEIINYCIPDNVKNREKYDLQHSIRMIGVNNPMYGKKRPEMSGENSPFRKMVQNGYTGHRKPKKVKIEISEIISLHKQGKSSEWIGSVANCSGQNINLLLRANGINMKKGYRRKANSVKAA